LLEADLRRRPDRLGFVLIAEDLLLLVTENSTGKPVVGSTELEHALAGAVLLELAMAGRVDVEESRGLGRKGRLVVVDSSWTHDPILDEALRRIGDKPGRKPDAVVTFLRKGLRDRLYARLAEQGILRLDRHKVIGLFPQTRWPAVDSSHEERLRRALHDALVVGVDPRPSVAAVISLLYAIRAVHKVVGSREEKKRVQVRAKEVSEGEWAAAAVRRAVDAVNAATIAAITAATAAASASG
jgi:hypothetical protein